MSSLKSPVRSPLSRALRSAFAGGGSGAAAPEGTEQFFYDLSSATNGVITKARGVCTITQVGNLNPIINTNRTSGVGPLHVQFDASDTQALAPVANRVYHELQYEWDFGDEIGATWSQGPLAGVASKNIAYGPVVGHVFENQGSYTATLTVRDPTGLLSPVSRTVSVTVTSSDTVFSGTNTVCLSTGTDFTEAPAGATPVPNATISNIQSALTAGKRVLLKRGDTWDTTTTTTVNSAIGILGAFGTGNRPKIRMTGTVGGLVFSSATDWRVVDVEITSDGVYGAVKGCVSVVDSTNILFLRADLNTGRNNFSASNSNGLGIFDSVIHESFTTAGICAYIDKVDNLAIYGTWMYLSTDHTCRVQGTAKAAISYNFFERPSLGAGCALTVRGKANDANVDLWNGLWTEKVVVSHNYCTTSAARGGNALAIKPQAVGHAERLRNILVEGNVLTSEDSVPFSSEVSQGLTFRNNIVISRFNFGLDFGYASSSTDVVPPPNSIWIYNNTFYKPDTVFVNGFSAIAITNTTAITGMVIKNNVAYAPNDTRDGYTNGTAPKFFSSNTATEGVNYELGVNSSDAQVKSTLPFTTAAPTNYLVDGSQAVASQFTPTGYPVSSGGAVPIYRDLLQAVITGTRELGAIQV